MGRTQYLLGVPNEVASDEKTDKGDQNWKKLGKKKLDIAA